MKTFDDLMELLWDEMEDPVALERNVARALHAYYCCATVALMASDGMSETNQRALDIAGKNVEALIGVPEEARK